MFNNPAQNNGQPAMFNNPRHDNGYQGMFNNPPLNNGCQPFSTQSVSAVTTARWQGLLPPPPRLLCRPQQKTQNRENEENP